MAGKGPVPKDPATRVRRNGGGAQMRVIEVTAAIQPELPDRWVIVDYGMAGKKREQVSWPTATRQWWDMWALSPLATQFTSTDWSELLIAALIHAEVMDGNYKLAAELRQRTAKFGTTPEDRARLKIQFAMADDAEERTADRRRASMRSKPGEDPRTKLAQ